MKWNYPPFEIPKDILDSWREIGKNGAKYEEKWLNSLSKNKKNINIKKNLNDVLKYKNLKNLNDLIILEKENTLKKNQVKQLVNVLLK